MTILRSDETAVLGEILSVGRGMLLRYRRLRDDAEPSLGTLPDTIVAARSPLLDRIETAVRHRGELPPAPDQEPNEIHAVLDRLGGALLGDATLEERIIDAERAWEALLQTPDDMAWDALESDTLAALRRDSQTTLERLAGRD